MSDKRRRAAAAATHPLLVEIVHRLKLQPQWVEHTPDGTAFVVTETGCWLSISDPAVLHIEIRVAVGVWDGTRAAEFCDARNHYALLGRWLYAPESGVVALVADVPIPVESAFDVAAVATEIVAELISAAGAVQFMSAPQRDLDGDKAVPALRGKIRASRNHTDEHLPRHTYLRGSDPEVAEETLILARDVLLIPLLGWEVEHDAGRTMAAHPDGSVLLLQVARHPHAGWGLVVSLQPPWIAGSALLNTLNAAAGSAGLTHWTANGTWVENRGFIPTAVLEAARRDPCGAAQFVVTVLDRLIEHRSLDENGLALQRPQWPGDDRTTPNRRREPWNDGREDDDPEWFAIYLDVFGRYCNITEPSYRRWYARLTADDLADEHTAGFIRFMEACIHDRDERLRDETDGDSEEPEPAGTLSSLAPASLLATHQL